jgi:hypothetical protein
MNPGILLMAKQLLSSVPAEEMADLIRLLSYYNRLPAEERAKAMESGSKNPQDPAFEEEVREQVEHAGEPQHQDGYI